MDGERKLCWVELIARPIKDKDANIIAALELTVGITEKKLLYNKLEQLVAKRTRQLKETQAKLLQAERLAAIDGLARMIGHDLHNPLMEIKGATYYLKTKYTQIINDAGKDMLRTVEKAIAYSNKPTLDLTETTAKSLLKNASSHIEVPARTNIVDSSKSKLGKGTTVAITLSINP